MTRDLVKDTREEAKEALNNLQKQGGKFTATDRKMVINAITLKYNGLIREVEQAKYSPEIMGSVKCPPKCPLAISSNSGEHAIYLASLNARERKEFSKILKAANKFLEASAKKQEAYHRANDAMRAQFTVLIDTLKSERDELILQASLLGSNEGILELVKSLRTSQQIVDALQAIGLSGMTQANAAITGIGNDNPTRKELIS